ncbi:MAG: tetratricopeptide repeat protein [Myxococcales bacterium]|nr:tetratricopeptide repeat protein [Myxococcales bacterium]
MKLRTTIITAASFALIAGFLASSTAFAADGEYLPGLQVKAQDAYRKGLAAALHPLPKCNPFRMVTRKVKDKDGKEIEISGCCPLGFASLGDRCVRIAPTTCARTAIENPGACRLTQCAKYIREIEVDALDKKGKKIPKLDKKDKPIEGEFEKAKKEIPCEPWKASGERDLTCELDTYECKKEEIASGPVRWCADFIKKIATPDPEDEAKTIDKFFQCTPGSESCQMVVRECAGKELTSNKSLYGDRTPCKIGEWVDQKDGGKCKPYSCPAQCKTADGRCAACGPDYVGAAKSFQAAHEADEHFYEAYFNHGMALERLGKYAEAVAVYEKARQIEPKNGRERKLRLSSQGYMARAKLAEGGRYAEAGNVTKAKQLRDQARSLCESIRGQDPDNTVANNTLAQYWLDNGDLKLAESFVKQVLRVNREDTVALNIRGLVNLRTKKNEIVRWILEEKVLALDPANPEGYANLGLAFVRLGQLPKAVVAFERSVKLKPKSVPARLNLGAIYIEYLNYEQAVRQYSNALKLEPENLEALVGYALALEGTRKPKEAAAIYEKVLSKDPKRAALITRLAIIYEKAPFNDGKKAVIYWKRFRTLANLPSQAETKANKDAAEAALKAVMKRRVPRRGAKREAALAARAEAKDKAVKAKSLWKNVLAIDSRIQAIEMGMKMEKEAKDKAGKDKPKT